jgi:hypothetical protein
VATRLCLGSIEPSCDVKTAVTVTPPHHQPTPDKAETWQCSFEPELHMHCP